MREPWRQSPSDGGAVGEAAEGLVCVELDAAGRVRDVVIQPQAMTMSPRQMSEALVAAFQAAQDAARTAAEQTAQLYGDVPPKERLQAVAEEVTAMADRRFAEISTALYDLTRRAERSW